MEQMTYDDWWSFFILFDDETAEQKAIQKMEELNDNNTRLSTLH